MDLSRRSFAYTGLSTATLMSLNWSFAAGLNGSGIPGSPEMEALGGCLECFESVPSKAAWPRTVF